MSVITCPNCHSTVRQVKAGMHGGNQRYKCVNCQRRYTPEVRTRGYGEEVREEAFKLAEDGKKPPMIARQLGVSPQTVANWLTSAGVEVRANEPETEPRSSPTPPAVATAKRKPSITDVAARCGVSVATISNYLNGKGRIGEVTGKRIQQAIEDLHFAPSALMRAILSRRTNIIGVMMFDLNSLGENVGTAIAPQLLAGITAAAYEAGQNVLLYTGLKYQAEGLPGTEFLDGTIDGIIWVAREVPEPTLDRLAAAGLPTVALLDRRAPDGIGFVDGDNVRGTELLVEHLVELGHTRIAYAGPLHSSNFQDRADGYRSGLANCGIPLDPDLVVTGNEMRRSVEAHADAIDRWLKLPNPPTAIMAQYDRWAATVISLLNDRGIRVPEEISVTGFDDAPDAAWIGGGLTTIRQPFTTMGQQSVDSLIGLIEGVPVADARKILPVELIVRATTAAVKIRASDSAR